MAIARNQPRRDAVADTNPIAGLAPAVRVNINAGVPRVASVCVLMRSSITVLSAEVAGCEDHAHQKTADFEVSR